MADRARCHPKPNIMDFMKTNRKGLLAVNAVLWAVPGIIISIKGLMAYSGLGGQGTLLLAAGSVLTLAFFLFIFSKVTRKYTDRIMRLPEAVNSVFMAMNVKGYILFAFMIALGMVLKSIDGMPTEFFASFYSGLGPALLYAALVFCRSAIRCKD